GHHQLHTDRKDQKRREQDAQNLLGEPARTFHAVRFDLAGKERHEGGIEGALREKPPKQVRKAERRIERIRDRARPKRRSHQRLPGKAQNAARHGRAADAGKFSDKARATEARARVLRWTRPFSSVSSSSWRIVFSRSGLSTFAPVRSVT